MAIRGSMSSSPDRALISLLARAHLLLRKPTDGTGQSLSEVAAETGVGMSEIGRILPLAFLSPDLVEAHGRVPGPLGTPRGAWGVITWVHTNLHERRPPKNLHKIFQMQPRHLNRKTQTQSRGNVRCKSTTGVGAKRRQFELPCAPTER